MPRPEHPYFREAQPTWHISHRGGSALAPENTMAAFQMAVDRFRTDVLELDVHLTSDGLPVVAHDASLARCTDGEGKISDSSWASLALLDAGYRFTTDGGVSFPFRGQAIRLPLLGEVLGAFPGVRFNIELKCDAPGAENVLAACIRGAGAQARVCVGSERDSVAERLLQALPEACFFYPREALTRVVLAIRSDSPWPEDDPYTVLDMPLWFGGTRLVDPKLIERVEARSRWVNVWTIDDAVEMEVLIRQGVGGIMTDRPDRLRAALDAARQRTWCD